MYRFSDDKLLIKRLDMNGKSFHACRYVVDSILIENYLTELEKDCIQLQLKHSTPTVDDKKFLVTKVGDTPPPLMNTVCLIGTYLSMNNKYDIPIINLISLLNGNSTDFKKSIDLFNSNFPDSDRATKKIHHSNKGELAYRYFRLGLSFIADSIKTIHELDQENAIVLKNDLESELCKLGITQLNTYRLFQSKLHPNHTKIMKDIYNHNNKVNFFHYNDNWYISLVTHSKFSVPMRNNRNEFRHGLDHHPHPVATVEVNNPVHDTITNKDNLPQLNTNDEQIDAYHNHNLIIDSVVKPIQSIDDAATVKSSPTDNSVSTSIDISAINKATPTTDNFVDKKPETKDESFVVNNPPKPLNMFTQNKPIFNEEKRVSNDAVTKNSIFNTDDDDDDFPIDLGQI